ncbi:Ig-like domain-containing protein [Methylobacterium sp. Leaf117]|uniref:Ig-like domain-containing protein n=1 Tax=Methylobacterium sp. Leaf117 TaxID=1736260 RepID=UPI0006F8BB03|nr:Ig-like domain-containing protein [Methylobacterium sp. Leaf117]KQP85398.1 hypothetical protein ASF57_24160 [Methylobacterium sp. Leaf117]
MSGDRSIRFTIPGSASSPGLEVFIVEDEGKLIFTLDVQDSSKLTADLRGLFFNFADPGKLAGLSYTGGGGLIAGLQAKAGKVSDLGHGVNMNGAVKSGFDAGLEFGGPGIGKNKADISGPITFMLDNAAHNLTLDDVANTLFGARLTSVGSPTGARNDSAKLTVVAPAAPDARDDSYSLFEDGQSGLDKPSHTSVGTLFQVLSNDTDADGDKLAITFIEGVQHGTAVIVDGNDADILVGDAILYTPTKDYAGTDSFLYRLSDNHGGMDAARVNLTIAAVADAPALSYEIKAGDAINQVRVIVTATQTDADGSEFIDKISLSNLPNGVTVSEMTYDPAAMSTSLVREFVLTLPVDQDVNFDLGISTWSKERSNGDTQVTTQTVPIVLENTVTHQNVAFEATDQSIWNTGNEFTFIDDRFIGIDTGNFQERIGSEFYAGIEGHIKLGFQSTLTFKGGAIDASADYDVTVETNYNKATDQLLIETGASVSHAAFTTEGPSGSYALNFLYDVFLKAYAGVNVNLGKIDFDPLGILPGDQTVDFGSVNEEISLTADIGSDSLKILDVNSDSLSGSITLPKPLEALSISYDWPDVETTGSSSTETVTSSGASDNFVELRLDVDEMLAKVLKAPQNPLDPQKLSLGPVFADVDLLDLDVFGGLNFLQEFGMNLGKISGTITFEDQSTQLFTLGDKLLINHASAIDARGDKDGQVDFYFNLAPTATLSNKTDLGFNIGGEIKLFTAEVGYDVTALGYNLKDSVTVGPVESVGDSLDVGSVDVYDQTFALNFGQEQVWMVA